MVPYNAIVRTCEARTPQALEFLIVFFSTIFVIEVLLWLLWRLKHRNELSSTIRSPDGEVLHTGGKLILAPQGVVASLVFGLSALIVSGIAGFPDACEIPAITRHALLSWFAFGYAALAIGNVMDAEFQRRSLLPQAPNK